MVRVVGENVKVNIYTIHKAKEMAQQLGLDLVEQVRSDISLSLLRNLEGDSKKIQEQKSKS